MDRIVPPQTLESTRAWLRAQAQAAEALAMAEKPPPTGRPPTMADRHRSLKGLVAPPFGGALVVPADVAGALAQWVRRAHIEVKYLPRDSGRRKTLVQAAYVTETFVRAAHDGEVLLPNPAMTCARIGHLMKMIELNQGIRHIEARRRELDLVRPWLAAWRSAMGATTTITSTSTLHGRCPDWPAAVEIREHSRSSQRRWIRFMSGVILATAHGCVSLPLSEQSHHPSGTSSTHVDLPLAASASGPVPHQEIHGDTGDSNGTESLAERAIAPDRTPAAAVRDRASVRVRKSTARRVLTQQPARSAARKATSRMPKMRRLRPA